MLLRRRHLSICERDAPMSDMAASMDAQRSITALNDVGFGFASIMESPLGQYGLIGKAIVAQDAEPGVSDDGQMVLAISATEDKQAFIRRVKLARMARFPTQTPICTILGISQGVYKHYEGRSALPYRFIPKFVAATGVDYEWLLTGAGKGPRAEDVPQAPTRQAERSRRRKAA